MRRLRRALAVVTLAPLAVGACASTAGGADEAKPTTTVTTEVTAAVTATHDMAGMQMPGADMGSMDMSTGTASGQVDCAQHMPGDILTAAEAMVVFDPEHVCLGYVTVRPGTPITWHNADDTAHSVTIEDGNGTRLMSFSVPAGGAAQRSIEVAGVYRFQVSAIESFVGTVEVDAG